MIPKASVYLTAVAGANSLLADALNSKWQGRHSAQKIWIGSDCGSRRQGDFHIVLKNVPDLVV
jgi:hypothetical protein